MKVFKIRNLVNDFQYFLPDESDPSDALSFDGTPRRARW
jgi:hypothetical protein